eukprot:Lankesteria_metandrocarpae@DN5639_c0_g1_i1.p1
MISSMVPPNRNHITSTTQHATSNLNLIAGTGMHAGNPNGPPHTMGTGTTGGLSAPVNPASTALPTGISAESQHQQAIAANINRLFPTKEQRQLFHQPIPKVLLCGLPRSGKTSIGRVVFFKTSPHETLYCNSTDSVEIYKASNTWLVNFTLIDVPGALLLDSHFDEALFPSVTSLIFVIDAQGDPYTSDVAHCKSVFKRASSHNPEILLQVFIHKTDGDIFSVEEVRTVCQRDIQDKLVGHLLQYSTGLLDNVLFFSTSIYDHTVFEACSRVVQRFVPQTQHLEALLDVLVESCRLEKAFLIDVMSKTFIATDTSPFNATNYEFCTDMVELVIEMTCIYGKMSWVSPPAETQQVKQIDHKEQTNASTDTTGNANNAGSVNNEGPNSTNAVTSGGGHTRTSTTTTSTIHLSSDHVLYLKEVERSVALACVIRAENFDRQALLDFNIRVFQDCLVKLFS